MIISWARSLATASLIVALLGGCQADENGDHGDETTAEPKRPPNIVLLTVDTLRADHMGLYGYERDTTPATDAFAEEAIVFDSAVVPRGYTRPSYASMLTGLYPYRHGVRDNDIVLNEELVTLTELLKAEDYHTAGFVSNFNLTGQMSGLHQGFDIYDDRLQVGQTRKFNYERKADGTVRAILDWMDTGPVEPFFLFINFMDPHGPYHPPEGFRKLFATTRTKEIPPSKIPNYLYVEGQNNYYDYVDRYDAEIRYTDEAVGILLDELKRRGLWDDTIVVFTADHGESLGEHGIYFEHRYHLWEETVRVPLVVRVPSRLCDKLGGAIGDLHGQRVDDLVTPMDLMPTLLALLEVECAIEFDGRDLLPSLTSPPDKDERMLLLEYPTSIDKPDSSMPDVYGIRTADMKLVGGVDQDKPMLASPVVFDVASDPLEQEPIRFNPGDPLHVRMAKRLNGWIGTIDAYDLPFELTAYKIEKTWMRDFINRRRQQRRHMRIKPLSEDQIERLRGLGYVQ